MTKTSDQLSRRKLLGRIGLLAAASYSVPAFTTLSMAQAGSGASGGGDSNGGSSNASAPSAASVPSADSAPSAGPSRNNGTTGGSTGRNNSAAKLKTCGAENLNDPTYLQCLVDNGF